MTLATFAHFSSFAPGIAPQVALAIDPTELGIVLASIVILPVFALVWRAPHARRQDPPRTRSRRSSRARGGVRACEATR